MVFAVQCPNPKCRKYMLIEEKDRDATVNCLICKSPIRLGKSRKDTNGKKRTTPPPRK